MQPTWDEQKEQALSISADNGYLLAEFSQSVMEANLETNQARLDLVFLQPVATAMGISPARRPAAPVLRQHPGSW